MSYSDMTCLKHFFREAHHAVTMRLNITVEQRLYLRIGVQILVILEIGNDMFLFSNSDAKCLSEIWEGDEMLADILFKAA